jgi:hypothetical protein
VHFGSAGVSQRNAFTFVQPSWSDFVIGQEKTILSIQTGLSILAVLTAIALASTVTALVLQTYFGRLPVLVILGQVLAAGGAAAFAIWLQKRD